MGLAVIGLFIDHSCCCFPYKVGKTSYIIESLHLCLLPKPPSHWEALLCCKSTIKSNVNGRQFSVVTNSDHD